LNQNEKLEFFLFIYNDQVMKTIMLLIIIFYISIKRILIKQQNKFNSKLKILKKKKNNIVFIKLFNKKI